MLLCCATMQSPGADQACTCRLQFAQLFHARLWRVVQIVVHLPACQETEVAHAASSHDEALKVAVRSVTRAALFFDVPQAAATQQCSAAAFRCIAAAERCIEVQ